MPDDKHFYYKKFWILEDENVSEKSFIFGQLLEAMLVFLQCSTL